MFENTGIASVTEYLRRWCKKNKRRNANKEMAFNVTGHQSLMILQSIPYSVGELSNLAHLQDLAQIRQYLSKTVLNIDEILDNIKVVIHWDGLPPNVKNNNDDLSDFSDNDDAPALGGECLYRRRGWLPPHI